MTSGTSGDDDKVVEFPKTAEERRALRKAKQDIERQRLVNSFVDEAGDNQALFHTRDGVAYADLIVAGHRETWPIRSTQFRSQYIRYLQTKCEAPTDDVVLAGCLKKSAVNAAIDAFEMRAISSPVEREVHVRVASDGDDLFLDLCNRDWHAIRVTADGWQVVESPPVRFRRTSGMLELPVPARGTSIDALRPFLNVRDENDFTLVVAFILAALRNAGPYPILVLTGEQGTAKSTFARIVRSLIDPSSVPLSSLPSSGRDLFIAANNSHVQSFENISKLADRLSDNLCQLATGGGFRIRSLYTNTNETLFSSVRPIVLNGISNFVTRGDLQDRSIVLPLAPISGRKTEKQLYADFERQRSGIFGALLELLVRGVRMLPETELIDAPRMADFATWATACGLDTFQAAYAANRQNAIEILLEHDLLAKNLGALLQSNGEWEGTAAQLLDEVGPATKIANPKALSDELRRLTPMLRTVGIHVDHERKAHQRLIRIFR